MASQFIQRILIIAGSSFALSCSSLVYAETLHPINSSGLHTQVNHIPATSTETIQYDITGGTRPGGGANLFHSFGDFNVPANNIANFINGVSFDHNGAPLPAGLPTENILARVTNPNPSAIFGTIQTTGFGHANLFLMNPSGIVFGPASSLHVGGSVSITTADYLRLADHKLFHAATNTLSDALLSAAPVAAYGFLGSNPKAINIEGSDLTVTEGTNLSLIGGNITLKSDAIDGITYHALLKAPGQQINLASVASPGEILHATLGSSANIDGHSFTSMGTIHLSPGTELNVSANASGTVRIRGGSLVIDNATLSANSANKDGAPLAIDVNVNNRIVISSDQTSALTAHTTGSGNAGAIRIQANTMDVDFAFPEFGVVIDASTTGPGRAGTVTITTGTLTATNNSPGLGFFVDTGTGGAGNGGALTINTQNGYFIGANINTGDAISFGTGSAGNLYIGGPDSLGMANSLLFDSVVLSTEAFSAKAGAITIQGHSISMTDNTFVSSISLLGENPITFNANQLKMDNVVRVTSQTRDANGGDIVFSGKRLEMSNESIFITNTNGNGNSGAIKVKASEYVRLADAPLVSKPSGLFTNSIGRRGFITTGNAGLIEIITPSLELMGGSRLSTTTNTAGRGGDVHVVTSEGVFISGQRIGGPPLVNFGLGGSDGSGIFTRTIGTDQCGGTCGSAGNQFITAGRLLLQDGGILDSGTTTNGNGGHIRVTASHELVFTGTTNDGTPSGVFSRTTSVGAAAGPGGNISLTAGQSVTIRAGAAVSASSTGPGNAGNISIHAGQQFNVENGSVTTSATHASGGNIDITATDLVRVVNGQISTSVLGGSGNGGNISIDPNTVILQNSQVVAKAVAGAGGNISISTPLFLADQSSLVDASSQLGLNGTVTIQSPTSNLSGTVGQLSSKPSPIHTLIQNRCVALADGQQSTFILSGRQTFPLSPGGWVSSPFTSVRMEALGLNESPMPPVNLGSPGILSLRQLTPPGFLVRSFAQEESTGCRL